MATNTIFAPKTVNNRARVVPEGTVEGDHLIINGRPAAAVTDRGDATRTSTVTPGNITSVTYKSGGASLQPTQATVAFDGTHLWDVTGVTTATGNDVAVYRTSATPPTLTLTEGTNTLFGYTDYPESYAKEAGKAPVRIGDI